MLKMKAIRGFYDRQADQYRPTGEVFAVDEKRAKELLVAGVAEVVEASAVVIEAAEEESPISKNRQKKRKKGADRDGSDTK